MSEKNFPPWWKLTLELPGEVDMEFLDRLQQRIEIALLKHCVKDYAISRHFIEPRSLRGLKQ